MKGVFDRFIIGSMPEIIYTKTQRTEKSDLLKKTTNDIDTNMKTLKLHFKILNVYLSNNV